MLSTHKDLALFFISLLHSKGRQQPGSGTTNVTSTLLCKEEHAAALVARLTLLRGSAAYAPAVLCGCLCSGCVLWLLMLRLCFVAAYAPAVLCGCLCSGCALWLHREQLEAEGQGHLPDQLVSELERAWGLEFSDGHNKELSFMVRAASAQQAALPCMVCWLLGHRQDAGLACLRMNAWSGYSPVMNPPCCLLTCPSTHRGAPGTPQPLTHLC